MRRLRLELSLSSRSVTIGTAALAYLHDAACRLGGEKKTLATVGGTEGKGERKARGARCKGIEGERRRRAKRSWMHRSVRVACISCTGRGPVKTGRAHSAIIRVERRNEKKKQEEEEEEEEAERTHSDLTRPACYLYVACLPTRVTIRILFA